MSKCQRKNTYLDLRLPGQDPNDPEMARRGAERELEGPRWRGTMSAVCLSDVWQALGFAEQLENELLR